MFTVSFITGFVKLVNSVASIPPRHSLRALRLVLSRARDWERHSKETQEKAFLLTLPEKLHYIRSAEYNSIYVQVDLCWGGGKGAKRRGLAPRVALWRGGIWRDDNMEFWNLAGSGELTFTL